MKWYEIILYSLIIVTAALLTGYNMYLEQGMLGEASSTIYVATIGAVAYLITKNGGNDDKS